MVTDLRCDGPFLTREEWLAVWGLATAHQTLEGSPALQAERVNDRLRYGIRYLAQEGWEFRQLMVDEHGAIVFRPGLEKPTLSDNWRLLGLAYPNWFANARLFLEQHLPHLQDDIELLQKCEADALAALDEYAAYQEEMRH